MTYLWYCMAWPVSIAARSALVIGAFGLIGPPVGGLTAWMMMGVRSLRSPLPFITGSYSEGLALALWTGAACCLLALTMRTVSWVVPIVAAALVCAIWVTAGAVLDPRNPDTLGAVLRTGAVFLPPSIVAAIACWMAARRLLRGQM
jgi:hypothetical protein